ncbi:MAG: hypothetical protein KatS3mg015_3179 [Fimbriimonadales bacterium]|nr:MAG: hypothetical protein KatS3mg015_3179 [Fimbriimonadales bacterium]
MPIRRSLSYSPSAVDTFTDCHARHWFAKHDDGSGKLPCDDTAARVSVAIHDAVMRLGREALAWYRRGRVPPITDAATTLRRLVNEALFRNRVDARAPAVGQRLAQAEPGLNGLAAVIVDETMNWLRDPATDGPLVWHEQWLDSGERFTGVILEDGVTSRTRADTIGIRPNGGSLPRVVIRDHKAKREAVDPRFDNGILVRAIWAAGEIADPRCPWFLRDRAVRVDATVIELETVNLLHGATHDFIIRTEIAVDELQVHRTRLAKLMEEMADIEAEHNVEYVPASPSALCRDYCPFLHRCRAGQEFVAGMYGNDYLQRRLSAA